MDTKTILLDRAEALTRTRGMDAFSFADLAQALEIKKASVHYHFPKKDDLALSLVTRYAARFLDSLPRQGSAGARLGTYLDTYKAALGKGDIVCLCVAMGAGISTLSPQVALAVNAFHAASTDWLHDVFAAGIRDGSLRDVGYPPSDAVACLAVVEGAQLLARASGDLTKFDFAVAHLRAKIISKGDTPCG
jgi:TetR/AcrR family transcriptional repressor of nem operon